MQQLSAYQASLCAFRLLFGSSFGDNLFSLFLRLTFLFKERCTTGENVNIKRALFCSLIVGVCDYWHVLLRGGPCVCCGTTSQLLTQTSKAMLSPVIC